MFEERQLDITLRTVLFAGFLFGIFVNDVFTQLFCVFLYFTLGPIPPKNTKNVKDNDRPQ